jgi:hypothetical protein
MAAWGRDQALIWLDNGGNFVFVQTGQSFVLFITTRARDNNKKNYKISGLPGREIVRLIG